VNRALAITANQEQAIQLKQEIIEQQKNSK
jgi:hypothetical protein